MLARRLSVGIGFCAAAALLSGGAWAADKAHVHGESKVKLAIEGSVVEIEFESPAHDIVGFESMPKTEKQRAAVESAVAALKKGEALFRLTPGAGCKLEEAEVETPLAESDHKEEQKHAEEEEHSEFHAEYRFRCAQPGRLKGVAVLLFDSFRTMREIEINAILPGGQRAASLKPGANRFDF